ncbi:MAG TPA: CotH kinase family protein [Polyangiales bacterium]|nr:CotH kinase family protein [Polyangiales bacterium]
MFDGITLTQVGVRNKGQTSFQPVSGKPGFSVKLDELVAGQKLDGLKKLLLNNTVQDPTWCNETLTYETYRRAGLPAPRVAFAVVTLNDQPKGIYSIGEAVNAQFLARHYGQDMDQGNLYEGPWDFSDPIEKADLKDEVEENRSRDDLRALAAAVLSEPDDGFPTRLASVLDVDQFLPTARSTSPRSTPTSTASAPRSIPAPPPTTPRAATSRPSTTVCIWPTSSWKNAKRTCSRSSRSKCSATADQAVAIGPGLGRRLSAELDGERFNAATVVVTPYSGGLSFNALNELQRRLRARRGRRARQLRAHVRAAGQNRDRDRRQPG